MRYATYNLCSQERFRFPNGTAQTLLFAVKKKSGTMGLLSTQAVLVSGSLSDVLSPCLKVSV